MTWLHKQVLICSNRTVLGVIILVCVDIPEFIKIKKRV